jgi:thiamine kinase-like enzyme
LKKAVLTALESMPTGNRICHMDFHPRNIILTENGPFIIDWETAVKGNPLADVAATSIIIWGGDTTNRPRSLKRTIEKGIGYLLNRSYLKHYVKINALDKDQYLAWLPIVAASRLNDGHLNLQKWLLSVVETGIRNYH